MANITLNHVWKLYNEGRADEVQAVKEVNLEIQDGEFLALLGPSGCGKTSTLRMIAGLEKISRGEIRIGDRLVNDLHPSQRDIAMVFESYALYEHLNVYENIAFPLRVRGLSADGVDRRVQRATEILDLGEVLKRMPAHISDGQKQRVSIGRAIVREPAAFLMDEPISHLDAMLRSRMRLEITHLQRELGTTTVYVTHDQLEATAMADRIVVMHLGEVQQVASPMEIFQHPANQFVADFVGEPPMNFLDLEITSREPELVLQREGMAVTVHNPAAVRALQALDQPRATLGVRPMHVHVYAAPVDGGVPAQVYVVEPLDEYNIITTLVGGQRVLVESDPGFKPELNQTVWLTLDQDRMHLFHPVSGKGLLDRVA